MIIKLKGTQAAAPTGSGTATNLSKATCVRAVSYTHLTLPTKA